MTPTGSDTARLFIADGEQTLLLQLKIRQPLVTISLERSCHCQIRVTVAPHKLIEQPESVSGPEICHANLAGPCLEQQA